MSREINRDAVEPSFVSADTRKRLGIAYTPDWVVAGMLRWAAKHGTPSRVVDPGAGTGRFALAAAEAFPKAEIIAIEIEPKSVSLLRNAVRRSPHSKRIHIWSRDFLALETLPEIVGRTLFIGNPPYVRHHLIESAQKSRYVDWLATFGLGENSKAGLHQHFFLQTRRLAKPGDYGAYIAAAEWMQSNYGSALRALLMNGMGGISVDTFPAEGFIFPDHMTTAAVVCFEVGRHATEISFSELSNGDDFLIGGGSPVHLSTLQELPRWNTLRPQVAEKGNAAIGDYFKVRRGQVTGMNRVFVASDETPRLPTRFLRPTITRAREIIESRGELDSRKGLRKVIDLPKNLDRMNLADRRLVDIFLSWAREQGADKTYIARQRACWWSVELYEPAPIVCTYMARRPPVFTLNTADAYNLNISHSLYPKTPMSTAGLRGVVEWLNRNVRRDAGRTYAGGLTKFEPGDVLTLPMPSRLVYCPACT